MTNPKYEPLGTKPVPRLLSIKQALAELGIGRTLLYELLHTGQLSSVKIRRRRLIPRESIVDFVASLRLGSPT